MIRTNKELHNTKFNTFVDQTNEFESTLVRYYFSVSQLYTTLLSPSINNSHVHYNVSMENWKSGSACFDENKNISFHMQLTSSISFKLEYPNNTEILWFYFIRIQLNIQFTESDIVWLAFTRPMFIAKGWVNHFTIIFSTFPSIMEKRKPNQFNHFDRYPCNDE